MTSKLSWIFFVPFSAAAVFFKLAQVMMPDESVLGLNDMMLDYAAIGCIAAVFVFALVFCLLDRKISPYYLPHRNIPAGILGLLIAVVCAADGANRAYLSFTSGQVEALETAEAVLLLLSSVVFIVMGLTHSFTNRESKHFALFNVMPALLCGVRLVRCFVGFTTISIRLADVTQLVAYIFATLFFFNFAVTISLAKARNAVKSCFIFGFPAAAALLSYGAGAAVKGIDTTDIFANAGVVEICLMGLYILAFIIELTAFVKDKDHVVIQTEDEPEPEPEEEDPELSDTLVVTGLDETEDPNIDRPYLSDEEVEGYLYQVVEKTDTEKEDDVAAEATQSDPGDYITNVVKPHTYEDKATKKERPKTLTYDNEIDELDKLILEISEDYEE